MSDLQRLQQYLDTPRLLVITGAGISTASGIGDYRDDAGEWKRGAPIMHADFVASHATRQRYWARSQVGFPDFIRARPNPAHEVLARWERDGRLVGLVTQNVDRLHQHAGHRNVVDLHGRLDQVVCLGCARISPRHDWQAWLEQHNRGVQDDFYTPAPDGDADLAAQDFSAIKVPVCEQCDGIVKPHVVFYGDSVPKARVQQVYDWVDAADTLLVVGSSLMVYSIFRFVRRAHAAGTPVVAINRGATRADDLLACKVTGDCAQILAALD